MAMKRAIAAAAMSLALAGMSSQALAAQAFQVPLDQARPLALKAGASGVVIGNPSIAGVSIQNDKLLFVTGKAYGTTNLIVVGANGRPVYEGLITVIADESASGMMMVTRGLTTVRQSCTPVCRKTPDLSDDPSVFDQISHQVESHAGTAGGN